MSTVEGRQFKICFLASRRVEQGVPMLLESSPLTFSQDHDVKRRRLLEPSPLLERAPDSGPSAPVPASGLLVPPAGGAVTTGVGSDALEGWRIRGGAGPDGEGDEEEDYNEEEPEKPAAEGRRCCFEVTLEVAMKRD
jgi:hypothetical protein